MRNLFTVQKYFAAGILAISLVTSWGVFRYMGAPNVIQKAGACYKDTSFGNPSDGYKIVNTQTYVSDYFSPNPADANVTFTGFEAAGNTITVTDCNGACPITVNYYGSPSPTSWQVKNSAGNVMASGGPLGGSRIQNDTNGRCQDGTNEEDSWAAAMQYSIGLTTSGWPDGTYTMTIDLGHYSINPDSYATHSFTVNHAAPPPPTVNLTASPSTITLGGSAILNWSSSNANSCSASASPAEADWNGAKALSGQQNGTPGQAGIETYTLTCTGSGGNNKATAQVTVNNVPPPNGTINVASQDVTNNQPVASTWTFAGSVSDPCNGNPCSGTSQQYSNQPPVRYQLTPTTPYPNGYSFNSLRIDSVAAAPATLWGKALSFVGGIIGSIARAWNIPQGQVQTLTSGNSISYTIDWQPTQQQQNGIAVNPSTVTVSSSTNYRAVTTISNTGSQGTTVNWNVSSVDQSWIKSVTPNSGQGLGSGNGTQLTVVTDPTGLAVGRYTGHVNFTGKSNPGNNPVNTQLTVTLVKDQLSCPADGQQKNGGPCPNVPICSISASPTSVIIPGTSTITYNCTNVTLNSCSLTGSDGTNYNVSGSGTTANGQQAVAPTTQTKYTIGCDGLIPNNPFYVASATVSVTITNPGTTECNPNEGQNCQ